MAGAGLIRATVHRPEPTVGFGRLDVRLPGYAAAVAAARAHGFEPVVREPGGHAAAYHRGSLVLEIRGSGGIEGVKQRFEETAGRLVVALRGLGVDGRVGEVPGAYCPGQWSVNLAGRVKLAGLAQRVARGEWMIGSAIICEDVEPVRAVLIDVYAALGLSFDPATVGVPGPPIEDVERAILAAYDVGARR